MIDIREHGGAFGGGKYRKGSTLLVTELGFPKMLEQFLYKKPTQYRIDGIAWDVKKNEGFICGYSTANGYNYMNKIVWNAGGYYNYAWETNPAADDLGGRPTKILLHPDGLHFFSNDKSSGIMSFSKHRRSDGAYVSRFMDGASAYALELISVSDDGQYIYGKCNSTLYKLDWNLAVISKVPITHGFWNNNYTLRGKYFLMKTGAGNKCALYDIDTGVKKDQGINTFWNYNSVDTIATIRDNIFYLGAGEYTVKFDMITMEVISAIDQNGAGSESSTHIFELDKGGQLMLLFGGVPYYYNPLDNSKTKPVWSGSLTSAALVKENLLYSESGQLLSIYNSGTDPALSSVYGILRNDIRIQLP